MSALLVLVIVLPPLVLLLGMGLGAAGARWWWARRAAALAACQAAVDEEAAAVGVATAVPSAVALPPGRKASAAKLPRSIHVVASSASLQPSSIPSSTDACLPLGQRLASAGHTPPPPVPAAAGQAAALGCGSAGRAAALLLDGSPSVGGCGSGAALAHPAACDPLSAEEQLRSLVGGSMGGSGLVPGSMAGSGSLSPGGQLGHRKTASLDLGTLVRAGPSVISQARCCLGDGWGGKGSAQPEDGWLPLLRKGGPLAVQCCCTAAGCRRCRWRSLFPPLQRRGVLPGPPAALWLPPHGCRRR